MNKRAAIQELRALLPRGSVIYGVETLLSGEYEGWHSVMLLIDDGGAWRNISALVFDALYPWLHIAHGGRRVVAISWGSLGWAVVRELSYLLYGEPKALVYRLLCCCGGGG